MGAYGAYLGCLSSDVYMAAVRTLPYHVAVAREYQSALDIRQQLAVTLLVLLLDPADLFEQQRYFLWLLYPS